MDKALNAAILHLAGKCWPQGFDVSNCAPNGYEELKQWYEDNGRIAVWSGGSDNTIFEDKEVNYAFRAWHDYWHLKNGHEFTKMGEYRTYLDQVKQLREVYPGHHKLEEWIRVLHAEICGQLEHKEKFGDFPIDQHKFVTMYVEQGKQKALEEES